MRHLSYLNLLKAGFMALVLALPGSAWANPVGGAYTFASQNFPVDFATGGSLTFNATGDLAVELESDSGGSLFVVEQFFAGAGAHGGDLLAFQFSFAQYPANPDAAFAFLISGLNWSTPGNNTLLGASLAVDFGVSVLPQTDVTPLTTAFEAGGLNLLFQSPVTWNDIYAMTNPPATTGPSQIVTTFLAEIKHTTIPEPASSSLLIIGALGYWIVTRRRVRSGCSL